MTVGEMQIVLGLDDAQLRSGISGSTGLLRSFAAEVQAVSKATGLSQSEVNRLTIGLEDLGDKGGKAMGDFAHGSSQANVAIMALGRGVADAGYGWQFALNNLDPFLGSLRGLKTEAAAAGMSVRSMLLRSLIGPAGLVVALGLATFAAAKWGSASAQAGRQSKSAAEEARDAWMEAFDAMAQVESGIPGVRLTPENIGGVISATEDQIKSLQQALADVQNLPGGNNKAFVDQTKELLATEIGRLDKLREAQAQLEKEAATAEALIARGADRIEINKRIKEQAQLSADEVERMRREWETILKFGAAALDPGKMTPKGTALGTTRLFDGEDFVTSNTGLPSTKLLKGFEGLNEQIAELERNSGNAFAVMTEGAIAADAVIQSGVMFGIDALSYGLGDIAAQLVTLEASWESVGETMQRVLGAVIADLTTAIAKAAMFSFVGAAFGIGPGGTFASNLTGILFGGGRASGGFVSPDTAYLVGERGPELFRPGQSGTIIPNHALGGSQVVEVRVVGSVTPGGDLAFSGQETGRRRTSGIFG